MKKIALNFLALWLLIVALSSVSAFGQSSPDFVRLTGNVSAALTHAQYIGHHDPTSILRVTIALKLRNTEQLQQFLEAVQDPTSSEYHQFLTLRQFKSMYDPTQDQLADVVGYLARQGLDVTGISSDNRLIHVTASSAALEQAMSVQINDYKYKGRSVFGTEIGPEFPASIANDIQAVLGLSNVIKFYSMFLQTPDAKNISTQALLASSSMPAGYSPQQIATAYNWPSITNTSDGEGVTIAIATLVSPCLLSGDYDGFWNYYGLPLHSVSLIPVDGVSSNCAGQNETTLDVERSGAMAPGANIEVFDGAENSYQDLADVFEQIVNDGNTLQVVTTSWGTPELNIEAQKNSGGQYYWQVEDGYFQQAAALGMPVFAAVGDGGSSDCRQGTQADPCDSNADVADFPSSDPYVVAAGGTTLTLNSDNTIANETAWSYSCNSYYTCQGTGGAKSILFTTEPSWQVGEGVPQDGVRNTSDISMDADYINTPYSFYVNGEWTENGGTSAVAPQLAALFAIQASLSSTPLGQANSAIYIDANNHYSTDFHDITSGSNGAFSAGVGWDYPTGWGSPIASELLANIAGGTISAPQNLDVEYTQCINGSDKYFITWQPPAIGTPSGGYDAEYEYQSDGVWHSFDYGPGTQAHIAFQAGINVGIRVRASNGSIWSLYNTDLFKTAPCTPAP